MLERGDLEHSDRGRARRGGSRADECRLARPPPAAPSGRAPTPAATTGARGRGWRVDQRLQLADDLDVIRTARGPPRSASRSQRGGAPPTGRFRRPRTTPARRRRAQDHATTTTPPGRSRRHPHADAVRARDVPQHTTARTATVERVASEPQHVPRRPSDEHVVVLRRDATSDTEHIAELRDLNLQRLGGSRRRRLTPQVVDQRSLETVSFGRQRESDQQRPPPWTGHRDRNTIDADLHRPEQTQLERRGGRPGCSPVALAQPTSPSVTTTSDVTVARSHSPTMPSRLASGAFTTA